MYVEDTYYYVNYFAKVKQYLLGSFKKLCTFKCKYLLNMLYSFTYSIIFLVYFLIMYTNISSIPENKLL